MIRIILSAAIGAAVLGWRSWRALAVMLGVPLLFVAALTAMYQAAVRRGAVRGAGGETA